MRRPLFFNFMFIIILILRKFYIPIFIFILLFSTVLIWFLQWRSENLVLEEKKKQEYLTNLSLKLEKAKLNPSIDISTNDLFTKTGKHIQGDIYIYILPKNYQQIYSRLGISVDKSIYPFWTMMFESDSFFEIRNIPNLGCFRMKDCTLTLIFDNEPSSALELSFIENPPLYLDCACLPAANPTYAILRDKVFNSKHMSLYVKRHSDNRLIKIDYITDGLFDMDEMMSAIR